MTPFNQVQVWTKHICKKTTKESKGWQPRSGQEWARWPSDALAEGGVHVMMVRHAPHKDEKLSEERKSTASAISGTPLCSKQCGRMGRLEPAGWMPRHCLMPALPPSPRDTGPPEKGLT